MQHSQRSLWTVGLFLGIIGFLVPPTCSALSALEFRATTNTVALGTNISINAAFTVEYWVRSTNSTAYGIIHCSTNNNFAIRHDPYNWVLKTGAPFGTQNSGLLFATPTVTFYVSENLEDNAWTHVAVTRDAANSLQIYLNGVLAGSPRTWGGKLQFDRIGGGLLGGVSDVRVWNHARSAAEITFDRYRRLTGAESGLLGYWPLDDASGSTAQDLSSSANHGTLTGASWASDEDLALVENDNAFVPSTPITLANFKTGSTEFTSSNRVRVATFPIPLNVDLYQITQSPDPDDLSFASGAWTNTATIPTELTFSSPAADEDVILYAWFTNSAASVTLRRASGTIRYTTAAPLPAVPTTLARETAGFTVRLLPTEFDLGSTGGTTGGKAIPIHSIELVDLTMPAADLTPSETNRTLPSIAGDYSFALRVINAAGNVATSSVCTVTLAITSTLPVGDRYVAIGNKNAASPYSTWTTAASDIQTAVNKATANETIYIARGTYQGSGTQIVSITNALQLIGAHPREEVILDGGDGAFGNRKGIVATLPAPIDSAPLLRLENLTVTRCFEQMTYGSNGQGIRLIHSNVTNGMAIIQNCVISSNRCIGSANGDRTSGTGLYALGVSNSVFHVIVSNCLVQGNVSIGRDGYGAGLYLVYGRSTVEYSDLLENIVGGLRRQELSIYSGSGGGAGIANNTSLDSRISFCRFEGNTALSASGGSYGGALDVSGVALTLESSVFRANQAYYAGAFRLNTSASNTNIVRNCLIVRNWGSSWGGGFSAFGTARILAENCTVSDNGCGGDGGGGGGIFAWNSCSIFARNSIIRNNTPNNGNSWGGTKTYEYCCTSPITDANANYYLVGNLDVNPLFVDSLNGDYRLTRASPCRNAGLNQDWMLGAKDLAGKPRLCAFMGTVDMGAYEIESLGTLFQIR